MEAENTSQPVKSRRVYEWSPPVKPPLLDLLGGREAARRWAAYWIGGKLEDGLYLALYWVFRRLPIDWVSNFGAFIGWHVVSRLKPRTLRAARANFRRLRPGWSDADIEAAVRRLYRHLGRVITEFAALTRLDRAGRIAINGGETTVKTANAGPLIIISLHTGNWEVGAAALHRLGLKWSDFYTPPASETQHRIANEIRDTFGIEMLAPGRAGVRPAIRRLKAGGCLSVFCDEVHFDKIMAPFFGRPPHIDGNLAIVARLARLTGARIIIGYTIRREGCWFDIHLGDPIDLPEGPSTPETLLRDVVLLNDLIEPIIAANLDQWYFLDNDL